MYIIYTVLKVENWPTLHYRLPHQTICFEHPFSTAIKHALWALQRYALRCDLMRFHVSAQRSVSCIHCPFYGQNWSSRKNFLFGCKERSSRKNIYTTIKAGGLIGLKPAFIFARCTHRARPNGPLCCFGLIHVATCCSLSHES